jgi:hypothetical protein
MHELEGESQFHGELQEQLPPLQLKFVMLVTQLIGGNALESHVAPLRPTFIRKIHK